MKHLNVRVLLANAVKSGCWVSHTFLQKSYCFKSFSILEENCAADIINATLNVRLLLAWAVKSGRWVSHTFLEKPCFLKIFSILKEKCGTDIINGTFKCKTFVGKCCKNRLLSKLYPPTKAKSFQFFPSLNIILKFFEL